jgi:hypothetical protein
MKEYYILQGSLRLRGGVACSVLEKYTQKSSVVLWPIELECSTTLQRKRLRELPGTSLLSSPNALGQ